MKKKTLLIFLIIATSISFLFLIERIINYADYLKFVIEHYRKNDGGIEYYAGNYKWIEIPYYEYRSLILSLIKNGLWLIIETAVVILFTIITITLIKREKLILTDAEKAELLEEKKTRKLEKLKQKELQLTAKIEKLKEKDDV